MNPTSRLLAVLLLLAAVATQRSGARSWTGITGNLPFAPTVEDRIEGRYDSTYDRTNMAGGDTGSGFLQADNSLLVLGANSVYRLGPDGGRTDFVALGTAGFFARCVDGSGRILLGGTQGDGSTHRVRRLLSTTGFPYDPAFPQLSANNTIRTVAELPGSGYLIGGDFSTFGIAGGIQVSVPRIVLVDYDGKLVPAFNANMLAVVGGAAATPYVAADGSIWIGINSGFKKVDATGQIVAGFTPYTPTAPTDFVSGAALLSSSKMLVTLGNSGTIRSLKRINADGTFDPTFNVADAEITTPFATMCEQADGKIILGGSFYSYGVNLCAGYLRMSQTGVFDSTFYCSAGFNSGAVSSVVYDPRGYVFMAYSENNATTGTFQDSPTIGRNFVRVFATASEPLNDFLASAGVPTNLRGPNDDADNDGFDNLLEYALDLNPNGSGGAFTGSPPALSTTPTLLQLTYRRVRNDVTYTVETSPTLVGGTWTSVGVTQGTPAGDGTTNSSIPLGTGSAFLRLVVTKNP